MRKDEFRILIAEDDEMVRDVMLRFLTNEGYPVVVANDGTRAIEMLRVEDVQMVITDLRMPGTDGMEVLRTALQMHPQIAVVLVTAYGTLDVVLDAMKEGAYDYLIKPFVMQQLLLVVRNAFKLTSLIVENKELCEQLRGKYRTPDTKEISTINTNDNLKPDSAERINKLRELNIIDADEARILKERMGNGDKNQSIKKYSSLVNNLRTES